MIDKFKGDHFFLSNFYAPAPVVLDGVEYPTTEHAYQAAKTVDPDDRRRIRDADTPGQAKRMGQRSPERGGIVVLREDWDQVKDGVMLDLCRQKFTDPKLRQLLADTGDQPLVEGNHWNDVYWGVCRGVGKNRLGEILMQIRDEIKQKFG
jgi:ribA/ribD-fused uncharacterized protein